MSSDREYMDSRTLHWMKVNEMVAALKSGTITAPDEAQSATVTTKGYDGVFYLTTLDLTRLPEGIVSVVPNDEDGES